MQGGTYVSCSLDSCSDSDESEHFDLNDDLNNDVWEGFDLNKDPPAECTITEDECSVDLHSAGLQSLGSHRYVEAAVVPPEVGMEFSNWDDMNNYHRSYGKQEGFGLVRIGGGKTRSYNTYVWKCNVTV